MDFPSVNCSINAHCIIHPSEDPKKVQEAVSNILIEPELEVEKNSITGQSENLSSLEKIYDTIHSRKTQRIYRRHLNKNCVKDSTWLYLNKQAALVNTITICDEPEESPLGPIKIVLTSGEIDRVIDWLISKNE